MIALLLAGLGVVLALSALWVASHTWRHAPGRRLWMELQLRVEDLEADNDALHERLTKRARGENAEKATAARVTKQQERGSLLDEAAAVLAAKDAPAAAQTAPRPLSLADEEKQLIAIRRTFTQH